MIFERSASCHCILSASKYFYSLYNLSFRTHQNGVIDIIYLNILNANTNKKVRNSKQEKSTFTC